MQYSESTLSPELAKLHAIPNLYPPRAPLSARTRRNVYTYTWLLAKDGFRITRFIHCGYRSGYDSIVADRQFDGEAQFDG